MTPIDIPIYREALQKEQFDRDLCWLGMTHTVAGFELREMTFGDYLMLRCTRNPVVFGGDITPVSLMAFLWLLSPDQSQKAKHLHAVRCLRFYPPPKPKLKWSLIQKRWEKQIADCLDASESALKAITEYLSETFSDWDSTGGHWSTPYWGEGADVIAAFAREYGFEPDQTLALPMKAALQFMREIRAQNDKGSFRRMANKSDKQKFEALVTMNRRN